MSSDSQFSRPSLAEDAHLPGGDHGEEEATISLEPLLRFVRTYHKVLIGAVLCVLPLYVAVVSAAYLIMPRDRFGKVQFEIRFDGAANGLYPNHLPFSALDVINDPVLKAVYERNQLQRYGQFEEFKGGLFVIEFSPEREILDFEYRGKLADPKLVAVDRQRIEDEYKRKRDGLKNLGFSLNFHRSERFSGLPNTLESKFLLDILTEWADQAVERKGVLKYDVQLPSAQVQAGGFAGNAEDSLAAIEILRRKAVSIAAAVDRVMLLPGASLVRVGPLHVSLTDIRTALEDLLRYRIDPLMMELARAPGVERFLRDQLLNATIDRNEAEKKLKILQDSLRDYDQKTTSPMAGSQAGTGGTGLGSQSNTGAIMPQVSESFLDRLVELSKRASDQNYRQNLTEKVVEQGNTVAHFEREVAFMQGLLSVAPVQGARQGGARDARIKEIDDRISQLTTVLETAYDEVSRKNLSPGTALFAVTGPVVTTTERALSVRQVGLYGVVTLLFTFMVTSLGCAAHAYLKKLARRRMATA